MFKIIINLTSIMTDVFTYTKKRNEIGLPPNYTNSRVIMKIGLLPEEET